MFIIASGLVEVTRQGRLTHVAKLSRGDYFSEMALLHYEPKNAMTPGNSPCVCLTAQENNFSNLLRRKAAMNPR